MVYVDRVHYVEAITFALRLAHHKYFIRLTFQSFPFAVTSAAYVKDAQAVECAQTISDGGSFSISGTIENLTTNCDTDLLNYFATKCPGCTVTVDGEVTFLEPPVSLGCNQDEINAANPCITTSSTTTVDVESSTESSTTSTSNESTVTESTCTVNGVVYPSPCDEVLVTDDTSGATAGGKIVSVGTITIVGVSFFQFDQLILVGRISRDNTQHRYLG